MFYNLHQHREATCRRQKEAWEETIKTRLEKEQETPSEDDKLIPIVIWGLEASPSFFDFNKEASEPLKNRIRTLDLLHENYLYNKSAKDGNNYGVKLIKKWINPDDTTKRGKKKPSDYSYETLITELSKGEFFFYEELKTEDSNNPKIQKVTVADDAIHLVYDIFPEWHGLPVSRNARDLCYDKSYMCSKVGDLEEHINLIKSIFHRHPTVCKQGEIHFVWLATQQGKGKKGKGGRAHELFFKCIKRSITGGLYYDPKGFFNGKDPLSVY